MPDDNRPHDVDFDPWAIEEKPVSEEALAEMAKKAREDIQYLKSAVSLGIPNVLEANRQVDAVTRAENQRLLKTLFFPKKSVELSKPMTKKEIAKRWDANPTTLEADIKAGLIVLHPVSRQRFQVVLTNANRNFFDGPQK